MRSVQIFFRIMERVFVLVLGIVIMHGGLTTAQNSYTRDSLEEAAIVGGYVPTCSRGFARSWAPGADVYTVRLKTPATLERRNVQHCVHHMNVQVSDNAVTRSLDGSVEETKRIYLDGAEYSSVEACRVGYTGAAHASENSERIDL